MGEDGSGWVGRWCNWYGGFDWLKDGGIGRDRVGVAGREWDWSAVGGTYEEMVLVSRDRSDFFFCRRKWEWG